MSLPSDFVSKLAFVHPKDIMNLIKGDSRPRKRWIFKNELLPVDLYCYLSAKFGSPNGIQNFLRNDSSDNLIHWEWFLHSDNGFVIIQGLNFRTEVWFTDSETLNESAKIEFVKQIKNEFSQYGAEIAKVRKALEHWIEFVNPYQRLRRSVTRLLNDLALLDIDTKRDSIPDLTEQGDSEVLKNTWDKQSDGYSRAIGLCFGVRSMLPVMAEAYVNLLLHVLMKTELKNDPRLKENIIRQQIDIRVRSLSHNCYGFKQHIDYSSEACKQFHSMVNERNDLLHGNVVIDKLRFNELYFNRRVPVFTQYSSMWERSFGVAHRSVGLDKVNDELKVVDNFIQYLLSCLDDKIKEEVILISEQFDLGLNLDDGRLGVLFSKRLVDMNLGFNNSDEQQHESSR